MNFADTHLTDTDDVNMQVLHPGSRTLFRYWETLRAERPCPTRDEFKLTEVRNVVPNLFIADRDYAVNTFRYRLTGTGIDRLFGKTLDR